MKPTQFWKPKCWATTMSSKGQVVIPAEVREQLNLKPGDRLTIVVQGRAIGMKKLATTTAGHEIVTTDEEGKP